jgi:hypothetical protein
MRILTGRMAFRAPSSQDTEQLDLRRTQAILEVIIAFDGFKSATEGEMDPRGPKGK